MIAAESETGDETTIEQEKKSWMGTTASTTAWRSMIAWMTAATMILEVGVVCTVMIWCDIVVVVVGAAGNEDAETTGLAGTDELL